ncbi:FG-GAP-like repeat-containing protein [Rhodopirellula sp. MGV]|uniref:FG-GAP-like repeat-containing protein n=1 Tax=Rhodopirellula sp. MGV TaxID=2023130 RepID=UPI000B96771F|nr:FG-GAP-like repeat-containing protein [Rhodopirellula sp. MGV]OYP38262.1 hypothetical protein CGZ80_03335 [Rhodopirellula sp. MGV]PNY38600.1 hypothetical protein C2E31_01390 [Rhodopirellula baltica]
MEVLRKSLVAAALPALLIGCGTSSPKPNAESSTHRAESQSTFDREKSLDAIRSAITSGDQAAAQGLVSDHLLRLPGDASALAFASQLARLDGDIDRAVELLDQAAVSADDHTKWAKRAAEVMQTAGRTEEAIKRYEAILIDEPDDFECRHDLVVTLNQRGFRARANHHARELCSRGEANVDELRALLFPIRAFVGFDEKPDSSDAETLTKYGELNVARALHSEGDSREAIELLRQSELVRAKDPEAVAFYLRVLADAKLLDSLRASVLQMPASSSDYADDWIAIGELAMEDREYRAAVGLYLQAVQREPGDAAAYDRLRHALAAAGEAALADKVAKHAVETNFAKQLARQLLTRSEFDSAAVDQLSKTLTNLGRSPEAVGWYRLNLISSGRYQSSHAAIGQAVELFNTDDVRAQMLVAIRCGLDESAFPHQQWLASIQDSKRSVSPNNGTSEIATSIQSAPALVPKFRNTARSNALHFRHRNAATPRDKYWLIYQQLGSGIACVDFDRDGQLDFYLAQAASDPPSGVAKQANVLYRQIDNRFVSVAMNAGCDDVGYAFGVTAGDWNQDGWPDLVVANLGQNTLLINQGDGRFVTHVPGDDWTTPMFSTGVAMGDLNGDLLPDLVEVNYLNDPEIFRDLEFDLNGKPTYFPAPLHFHAASDRVFLSKGDGNANAVPLGPDNTAAPGLGVLVTRLGTERQNGLYVANDRMPNQLWHWNTSAQGFADSAAGRGIAFGTSGQPMGSMGIAAADFDQNGQLDLHVTNFENEWSNQYMQDVSGHFSDRVVAFGLEQQSYPMVGFGAQAIDFDNNGAVDLVVGQGHIEDHQDEGRPFAMPTELFRGDRRKFTPVEALGDDGYWQSNHLTRAVATCDYNKDGRIDFVTTELNSDVSLLVNETATPYHWIQFELVGTACERDAIGAQLIIQFGEQRVIQTVQTGDGYMSKNEAIAHFGLGTASQVDRLHLVWPDGSEQTFDELPIDHRWLIIQGQRQAWKDRE